MACTCSCGNSPPPTLSFVAAAPGSGYTHTNGRVVYYLELRMETQGIINTAFAMVGALAMLLIRTIFQRQEVHDQEIRDFPRDYVSKVDYDRDIQYVKNRLDVIVDRLGAKADR